MHHDIFSSGIQKVLSGADFGSRQECQVINFAAKMKLLVVLWIVGEKNV